MKKVHANFYHDHRPIIFFDGYCNLCSASVQFILKHEQSPYYYFSSLQSDFVKTNFPELFEEERNPDSVILLENESLFYRSDAALRISRKLRFPLKMMGYFRFIPVFIRDPVYDLIARNRYRYFGKRESCFIPESGYSDRFLD